MSIKIKLAGPPHDYFGKEADVSRVAGSRLRAPSVGLTEPEEVATITRVWVEDFALYGEVEFDDPALERMVLGEFSLLGLSI